MVRVDPAAIEGDGSGGIVEVNVSNAANAAQGRGAVLQIAFDAPIDLGALVFDINHIVTIACIDTVIPAAGIDYVIASATVDRVVACVAPKLVSFITACNFVVGVGSSKAFNIAQLIAQL